MPRYSPDEIKSLVLHYGSYEKAAKKLKIGKASLVDAANADIKGKAYTLSDANYKKIFQHINRLKPSTKRELKEWEKVLAKTADHLPAKKAFMNAKQSDREWARKQIKKYGKQLKDKILFSKIMSKFYDKYGWQRGRFR